jgi:hypothetical protein
VVIKDFKEEKNSRMMKLFFTERHRKPNGFNGNIDIDSLKPIINTTNYTSKAGIRY